MPLRKLQELVFIVDVFGSPAIVTDNRARNSCWRKATVWKRTIACTLVAEIWITHLSNIKSILPATCCVGRTAHKWNQTGSNLTGFIQSRLQRNTQNNIRESNTTCFYTEVTQISNWQTKWRQSYFAVPLVHHPLSGVLINNNDGYQLGRYIDKEILIRKILSVKNDTGQRNLGSLA
jgi:ribosome modulation factor